MKKYKVGVVGCCLVGLLSSCAPAPTKGDRTGERVLRPLSCVAVLPARMGEDEDVSRAGGVEQNVRLGAQFADTVLRRELGGEAKVRFAAGDAIGNLSTTLADAAASTGCDAVMVTSVYRFRQRQGTDLAIDEPASASFDFRIYDPASMHVLWAADYSETQEPVLGNLLTFGKAAKRGFKWVTVEDLMEQGLKTRIEECPYLKK